MPTRQGGGLEFRAGSFLRALCTGQWLVIDEINRAEIDKAFGELFTVLSGQGVELPYMIGNEQVCIFPAQQPPAAGSLGWVPQEADSAYDYIIHPNWRIIGTMNVYDKSQLYQMSFAFMRRFAFVDLALPNPGDYAGLVYGWLKGKEVEVKDPEEIGLYSEELPPLQKVMRKLLDADNHLMKRRALGPAIVRDLLHYVGDRKPFEGENMSPLTALAEALAQFVVPQLDGLDPVGIRLVYHLIPSLFEGLPEVVDTSDIQERIRQLYPHIQRWTAVTPEELEGIAR